MVRDEGPGTDQGRLTLITAALRLVTISVIFGLLSGAVSVRTGLQDHSLGVFAIVLIIESAAALATGSHSGASSVTIAAAGVSLVVLTPLAPRALSRPGMVVGRPGRCLDRGSRCRHPGVAHRPETFLTHTAGCIRNRWPSLSPWRHPSMSFPRSAHRRPAL